MNSSAGAGTYARFESRAGNYARHRPGYPPELLDELAGKLRWQPGAEVADVGSGTGLFTRQLLERGLRVTAIEPAAAMRAAAERALAAFPGLVSVAAVADATTLPDASVDSIVCAQAFHWFNHEGTRAEWRRILRPGGEAALVWNLLDERDALTRDYLQVVCATSEDARAIIGRSSACAWHNVLFDERRGRIVEFPWAQPLDLAGLLGRTESVSYAPKSGTAMHATLMDGVRAVFRAHERDGVVRLVYRTVAVHGPLA